MPKPPTFQRPMPVNRTNKGMQRPGAPIGNPGRKAPRPPPSGGPATGPQSDLKLDLNLPGTPKLPWR